MVKCKPIPSQSFLLECFVYCQETGVLRWKERPLSHFLREPDHRTFNTRQAGKVAGVVGVDGHRLITICNRKFYAARIIRKMMTGEDPIDQVDHRNGDKADNRWTNLRQATNLQNTWNRPARRDSSTLLKGAIWNQNEQKFCAKIKVDGAVIWLGYFDTAREAHMAYRGVASEVHGEFSNFSRPTLSPDSFSITTSKSDLTR